MRALLFIISFFLFTKLLIAQTGEVSIPISDKKTIDTSYIQLFPNRITTRIYLSQKISSLEFDEGRTHFKLNYVPNTDLNLGIGATVRGFTINLAYGFQFLNIERGKGDTRYLDLQSHFYGNRYVIDFYGQFYNGLYLENNKALNSESGNKPYIRPDIKLRLFGLSFLRVHSGNKFSYAAPFIQNAYQKKSAGSFLYGGEVNYLVAKADSSFFPSFLKDSIFRGFNDIKFVKTFQFGPSLGYAYSLIVLKHIFLTVSLNTSFLVGPANYESSNGSRLREWQLNPSATTRLALGYNSVRSYFGLTFITDEIKLKGIDNFVQTRVNVANMRIIYAKRFKLGPKSIKRLDKLAPNK